MHVERTYTILSFRVCLFDAKFEIHIVALEMKYQRPSVYLTASYTFQN